MISAGSARELRADYRDNQTIGLTFALYPRERSLLHCVPASTRNKKGMRTISPKWFRYSIMNFPPLSKLGMIEASSILNAVFAGRISWKLPTFECTGIVVTFRWLEVDGRYKAAGSMKTISPNSGSLIE